MTLPAFLALCIAVSVPLAAQRTPNPRFRETAVVGAFRRLDPAIVHFTTVYRGQVAPDLDLAVIRGGAPKGGWGERKDVPFVGAGDVLGVFLLSRSDPDLAYVITLDREAGAHGGRLEVVWAGADAVVLSRKGDYGIEQLRLKYFFDVKSKSLLGRREFAVGGARIESSSGSARLTAVEFDGWALQQAAAACGKGVGFGPRTAYSVVRESDRGLNLSGCVVRRRDDSGDKTFAVPISSYEAFAAARPEQAKTHSGRNAARFNETIGPTQAAGGRLWFGLTFYDGEGLTGVGGFGWFDPATEEFEIIRGSETANWSASAILVEDDAVWLGLMRRPEGMEYSGGLLRWDRTTGKARRWAEAPLVHDLRRDGARMLVAGEGGGAIVDGDEMELYVTDVDLADRYRLKRRRAHAIER